MTTASKRIILDKEMWLITPLVILGGMFLALKIVNMFVLDQGSSLWIHTTAILFWLALYSYWGFRIIPNREYLVIERFGIFNRIVHSGPRILCLPGLIDKIVDSGGSLRSREIELFADEKPPYQVDFIDGSAQVRSKAWYCLGPEKCNDLTALDEAIYDFTYTLKNEQAVRERIEDVLESSFVPQLQRLTIAEALVQKDTVAENAVNTEVRDALKVNGIYLIEKRSFIITDIVLPDEIIKQRQKKLEGESEANKQEELGAGYGRAIAGVIKAARAAGKELSWEAAQGIYERQRGFETLGTTGSKISFVASDIKGIQKTIGIGDANPNN